MAPTMESFFPSTRSPRLPVSKCQRDGHEYDLPLSVALSLGGLDLGLSLSVLFLSGGGEGGGLLGTANGRVGGLDTASEDFLSGADDGVELYRQQLLCDSNKG
jgi:hypothetical protein